MMTADHVVYRAYGNRDALLYVGYSGRLFPRLHAHLKRSPWWPAVREITVQTFATEAAARTAESAAITSEQPLFNIVGAVERGNDFPTMRPHVVAAEKVTKPTKPTSQRGPYVDNRPLDRHSHRTHLGVTHVARAATKSGAEFLCGLNLSLDQCQEHVPGSEVCGGCVRAAQDDYTRELASTAGLAA